ncbi:MAG: hypothetical protein IKG03_06915 [Clostridiales bacterium]|nr:hypothetical protein [Clostridiales bacterium]
MTNNLFLIYAMFFGMWVYSALSLALFITYLILNKNNNFGDFAPKIDEYSTGGIRYRREVDNVSSHEKTFLFSEFGENPYEGREHRYPEHLLRISDKERQDQ